MFCRRTAVGSGVGVGGKGVLVAVGSGVGNWRSESRDWGVRVGTKVEVGEAVAVG